MVGREQKRTRWKQLLDGGREQQTIGQENRGGCPYRTIAADATFPTLVCFVGVADWPAGHAATRLLI